MVSVLLCTYDFISTSTEINEEQKEEEDVMETPTRSQKIKMIRLRI